MGMFLRPATGPTGICMHPNQYEEVMYLAWYFIELPEMIHRKLMFARLPRDTMAREELKVPLQNPVYLARHLSPLSSFPSFITPHSIKITK